MVKFSKTGIVALVGAIVISGAAWAGVTWLPNYSGELGSFGTDTKQSTCSDHNMLSDCPAPKKGTKIMVTQGLYCYKSCTCPSQYKYGYGPKAVKCSNGSSPSGDSCYSDEAGENLYTGCGCPSNYVSSCPAGQVPAGKTCNGKSEYCVCSTTEYPLTSRPSDGNLSCKSCSDKNGTHYQCSCNSGYSCTHGNQSKGSCTSCTKPINCRSCHVYNSYTKQCVCDTAAGLTEQGGECVCNTALGWLNSGNCGCAKKSCPTGYSTGVTSCDQTSTTPTMKTDGYSGGEPCNKCACNKPACDHDYYNLESVPAGATNVVSCTEGCGSNEKTYYHADLPKVCREGFSTCDKSSWCNGDYLKIEHDSNNPECTSCVYDDYDLSVKECRLSVDDSNLDFYYNRQYCETEYYDFGNEYSDCLDKVCARATGIEHRKTYISSCEAPQCASGYKFNPQDTCRTERDTTKGVYASQEGAIYCKKCGRPDETDYNYDTWYRWGGCKDSIFAAYQNNSDPAYPACTEREEIKQLEPTKCESPAWLDKVNFDYNTDESRLQAKTYALSGCCAYVGDIRAFCHKLGYLSDTMACDINEPYEDCPCDSNRYYWRGCKPGVNI